MKLYREIEITKPTPVDPGYRIVAEIGGMWDCKSCRTGMRSVSDNCETGRITKLFPSHLSIRTTRPRSRQPLKVRHGWKPLEPFGPSHFTPSFARVMLSGSVAFSWVNSCARVRLVL